MELLNKYPAQILLLIFLIITFLISFLEKVFSWKKTLEQLKEQFKKTFVYQLIPVLLLTITVLEFITFVLMSLGIYYIHIKQDFSIALLGAEFGCITLLFLLIGQRIAKDYQSATNITVYFIVNILAVFFLTS